MAEKICAKVGEKQDEAIKNILREVRDSNPGVEISSFRFGSLGDETIVSFNVDDKHHRLVVNTLLKKNVRIVPLTEVTKKIIDEVKPPVKPPQPVKSQDWSTIKEKKSQFGPGDDSLEKAIQTGNYKKVIEISKDIRNNTSTIKSASEGIKESVMVAIEKASKKSKKNRYDREEAVDDLLEIASDKVLKAMGKSELLKIAGSLAVKICAENQELHWQLVKICNNNSLHYGLILKSAVRLSGILLGDPETHGEDVEYAVKNLNIRWLNVSFDIVGYEMREEEQKAFHDLIQFIKANRS